MDAILTVFRLISAEVPPMTMARWYGGHADVPSVAILATQNDLSVSGFRSALVSWYRKVLLAEPPPFEMKRNS